ncbi:MAG: MFS transporter [Armatimonadetes bacterium]|nr:MFS transporter [Armatimonadota bacterium]
MRALRHRDFLLLWTGALASFIGSWIQTVAQGYLVYQMTGSERLLAEVTFAGSLPVTILGPFAGSLTDLVNKRLLLNLAQAIFAIGALFLAAATYYHFVQYWHIVVTALVLGVVSCFEVPTRQSIVSRVVPPEDLAGAIPINAAAFNVARLIGPAIGGKLLQYFGPETCYFINGISFFALIFAALAIKADLSASKKEPQPIKDLLVEGMLYTFRNTALKTLFILECTISAFGLFYIALMPALAKKVLHLDKAGLGNCYSAVGVGSVTSLLLLSWLSVRPIKAMLLRGAMSVLGLSLLALSFVESPWVAYVIFATLGFGAVAQFNITNMAFQTLAPDRLRGRAIAMHMWALSGVAPFGTLAMGYLAEMTSIQLTLRLGSIIVLAGALYAIAFPKTLRELR